MTVVGETCSPSSSADHAPSPPPPTYAAASPDDLTEGVRRLATALRHQQAAPPPPAELLAAYAREHFGELAVLVNAAGAPPVVEAPDLLTWERWRTPIDVDVRGVFHAVRALAPLLGAGATVVNVASGAVAVGSPLHASYSPGRAALLSLSRCLGAWLAPRGVATHCLCPSLTLAGGIGRTAATAFASGTGLSEEEWMRERFGEAMLTPEQAGDAVVALLDDRDGGDWMLGPRGLVAWQPLDRPAVRS